MVQSVSDQDTRYEENMERVRAETDALHYINSPAHGAAVLREVATMSASILRRLSDDPALAACEIYDILPDLYGCLALLNTWCYRVRMADPGAIPDHGARSCP